MLRFCIIIINLARRFVFATSVICLSLHFYLPHLLNLENVSILILLRGSKKSLDFSIHRSLINVSIRSVPSLKSLNESETNFSVANIPFDMLSKGFSLNGSIKHSSIIDKIDVTSSWLFLILDFCKSVRTYFSVFAPKNSYKCEYKLARYEALIVHRSTALVLVLKPVSPPGVLVSLLIVFLLLSQVHIFRMDLSLIVELRNYLF